MYAGIIIGKDGKVPYHVRDGDGLAIYDLDKGIIEKTIPLDGIKDEKRPGRRVATLAVNEGVDYFYTGRKLSIFGRSRWKLILEGIKNRAGSGKELSDIVRELQEKDMSKEKLAPAYG